MATTFTPDELVFLNRMLPHFMAGKSVEESAAAVLQDDQRIVSTVMDWTWHSPTAGKRAEIRRAISNEIYTKLRAA